MIGYIVDASVAIKWYRPETDSAIANEFLAIIKMGAVFHAPTLIFAEVANIVWKKQRLGDFDRLEASEIVSAFVSSAPITFHDDSMLIPIALRIAMSTGRTVYDSLYLSLAAQLNYPLVTADKRLVNALAGTPWSELVVALHDWRPA